jgi:hypothetical protein
MVELNMTAEQYNWVQSIYFVRLMHQVQVHKAYAS